MSDVNAVRPVKYATSADVDTILSHLKTSTTSTLLQGLVSLNALGNLGFQFDGQDYVVNVTLPEHKALLSIGYAEEIASRIDGK